MADTVENHIQPPTWLNKDYIQDALRESLKDDSLVITEYNIRPAVGVGDNYTSRIFRVSLQADTKDKNFPKSLIVKVQTDIELIVKFAKEQNLFEREANMLATYVPRMMEIEKQVGDFSNLCAKSYYYREEPSEIIILEDLCQRGFANGDRFQGLNLDQCVTVVEAVARLHAASMVLLKQQPEVIEYFTRGFWGTENGERMVKMYDASYGMLEKKLEEWSELGLLEKVKKFKPTFDDQVLRQNELTDTIQVINHGDLWTNNMMFKFVDDKKENVSDIKFVDLQLSYYGNPTMDLVYFLFSSPRNDIKLKRMKDILKKYHDKFSSMCRALGVNIDYSLEDLLMDFKKRLTFALAVSISIFPLTCAPSKDALDTKNASAEKNPFQGSKMYDNLRFKDGILEVLAYLDENGLFD